MHGAGDAIGRDSVATRREPGMSMKKAEEMESVAMAATWQGPGRITHGDPFLGGAESILGRARKRMRAEAGVAWAASGAYERVALSYLGISSTLIAYFAKNLQHPLRLLGVQAGVALVVLMLCWVGAHAAAKEARIGAPDDAVHTRMARREIIGLRSLADRSAAYDLAGSVRHAAAE